MNHDVPEHELIDDSHDPIARALREAAPAERLSPSPQLRHRTLDALRASPATRRVAPVARRPWMTILAAAAMIALAVLIYSVIKPASSTNPQRDNGNVIASGPGADTQPDRRRTTIAQPIVTASARLASFTQPLEREAKALQNDLKRVAAGFRSVLPKSEHRFNLKPATNPSS